MAFVPSGDGAFRDRVNGFERLDLPPSGEARPVVVHLSKGRNVIGCETKFLCDTEPSIVLHVSVTSLADGRAVVVKPFDRSEMTGWPEEIGRAKGDVDETGHY